MSVSTAPAPRNQQAERPPRRALARLGGAAAIGAAAGVLVASTPLPAWYGVLTAWAAAALVHLVQVWTGYWHLDSKQTQAAAMAEDPTRPVTDAILLVAAVASLAAVILVVVDAANQHGAAKGSRIALGLLTVVLSWFLVHTLFTARYARTYYVDADDHGIDFHDDDPPVWSDFAYVSFTVGMTFQIADTDLSSARVRRLALSHMLLSYLFGAVIIALTINAIAGLTR